MKSENVIRTKSFAFAVKIVGVYKRLIEEKREFVLSKQLLRSATSVGANIEEAIGGYSEREFLMKIGISYKEARESIFWIRLLKETDYLSAEDGDDLLVDANEICRILGSIQVTMKEKLNKGNS
jgi:four helix bundle protein